MDEATLCDTLLKTYPNNLVICQSKALKVLFTTLRAAKTTQVEFVRDAKRAMRLLAEDALVAFPCKTVEIQTPTAPFTGLQMALEPSDVCAVSVIRSGDALLNAVREIAPGVSVGKILIQRDESLPNKPARLYYSKLPPNVGDKWVLLCDPMLATGGSAIKALQVVVDQYKVPSERVVFCNMISCPQGLQAVLEAYPKITIVTACVDAELNEEKFIVPGLGDYGDRFFGTTGEE